MPYNGLWLHHDEDECSRLVFLGDHPDCAVDRDWREQFDEVVSFRASAL